MVWSSRIDSDLVAVLNEEASESNRTAGLQTLARNQIAAAYMETSQLYAIGEKLSDGGVAHFFANMKLERVQLAAAFGQLAQARIA